MRVITMQVKIKQQLTQRLKPIKNSLLTKNWAAKVGQQKSRPLTEAEIKMAHSVFGPDFDLRQVRLKTAWWVLRNYAVSPNGNIYFNPKDWVEDFSKQSLGKKSWLIHELTHVWQLQQGLKVVRGAVINRRYDYILQQDKPFFTYGIEQQARMVQDYFVRREQGKDCGAWQACIPFLQHHNKYKNKDDNNKDYKV